MMFFFVLRASVISLRTQSFSSVQRSSAPGERISTKSWQESMELSSASLNLPDRSTSRS